MLLNSPFAVLHGRPALWPSGLFNSVMLLLATIQTVSAHFQIVYPAWRANTLKDDLQWDYPCGGQASRGNRTNWPVTGGALSIVPGWNAGHPTSFFYVNMGFGTSPRNMTNVMLPIFQTTAPSKAPFEGHFCMPNVPLPKNASVEVGQNATIQVIQVALHGASLYNCADITFVEPEDADPMPEGMCSNSSTIGFNLVYSTHSGSFRSKIPRSISAVAFISFATGLATFLA